MFELIQLALITSLLIAAGHPQSGPLQVVAVNVDGEKRYTQAEVVRASGIEIGKVTLEDLAAALKRMAATGLFKSANYRYLTAAGRTTVILEIEEAEWTMPVEFDNFVWFKDEEIAQALRVNVFSFDGKVPATAGVPELVMSELQKILAAKKLPGTVEFVPQGTLTTGIEKYVFKVNGAGLKVCGMKFPGSAAIKEEELSNRLGIAGNDYSRSFVTAASKGTLTDMYHQRGRWRASIGPPAASMTTDASCSGVVVTLTVEEGSEYAWNAAAWTGNSALAARDLDGLLAIKTGDVANVTKINDGLLNVRKAYEKQGYLRSQVAFTPRLDDAEHRATPELVVKEGPQYRFGSLEFPGLSAADAETLRKLWKLRVNDVFDASYPNEFLFKELRPRLKSGAPMPATQMQVDEQNRLVHVKIGFGPQGVK